MLIIVLNKKIEVKNYNFVAGAILLIIYLNPYTLIGPVGYYLLALFLFFVFCLKKNLLFIKPIFSVALFLMVLGLYASLNSGLRGYSSGFLLVPAVTVLIYTSFGYLLVKYFDFSFKFIVLTVVAAATINGAIIIFEVFLPEFRKIVESLLIDSGNIDWSKGFRFRGIASGGGASLSLFCAFAIHCCLYWYFCLGAKKLNVLLCSSVIAFSVLFIGRTGVFLSGLIAVSWLAFYKPFSSSHFVFRLFLVVFFVIVIFLFFVVGDEIFGPGFTKYVLGAFMSEEGLSEEGTLQVLLRFWSIYPTEFPAVILGYGSFLNDHLPYMDAGYNRTVVSLGFPLTLIFYTSILTSFLFLARGNYIFFVPFLFMLMIGELKESLLFSGYAARAFMICLGSWFFLNKANLYFKDDFGVPISCR